MALSLVGATSTSWWRSRLAARPFCVGFAAETRDLEKYAKDKLERKNLDMIAANLLPMAAAVSIRCQPTGNRTGAEVGARCAGRQVREVAKQLIN